LRGYSCTERDPALREKVKGSVFCTELVVERVIQGNIGPDK
jgi:hypothetical protein